MNDGAAKYRAMELNAMSPARRIVFLYTFLLGQLEQADRYTDADDAEGRSKCLSKAQDVVTELLVILDRDAGGEIADQLAAIYAYFLRELEEIGVKPDKPRLNRLISLTTTLRDAWSDAERSLSNPPDYRAAASA